MIYVTAAGIDIVSVISPENETWTSDDSGNLQFTFNYTGDNATASCELFIDDVGYGTNTTVLNDINTTISANASVSEGSRVWYVNCTNGTVVQSSFYTLNVDRTQPDINFTSPTLSNNSYTNNASLIYVNVSADETLNACLLYNTTDSSNTTMTVSGSYCYFNITGLVNLTSIYFYVYANDSAGNMNTTEHRNITVNLTDYDLTPPVTSLISPANNYNTSSSEIDFQFNVTDNVATMLNCSLFINSTLVIYNTSTINATATNFTITVSESNYQNWTVNCTDGSNSHQPAARIFSMDQTFPDININSPDNTTYNNYTVYFNITAAEAASWCGYSLDTQNNITMTSLNPTSFWHVNTTMTDGYHSVLFSCNDSLDNLNTTTQYFAVDTIIPVLAITHPASTTYYNVTYFNYTLSEAADICWYNLNSAGNTTFSCGNETSIPTSQYSNTLEVYANDSAGNIGGDTVSFTADWTSPSVTIHAPITYSNYSNNESIALNYSSVDNNRDSCWYQIDTGYNNTIESCANTTFNVSGEGIYTISLFSNDSAGNTGYDSAVFTVDMTDPVVSITYPLNTTYYNMTYYNLTVIENLNYTCQYKLDSGNTTVPCKNYTQIFVPPAPEGIKSLTVYVNDSAGNLGFDVVYFTDDQTAPSLTIHLPQAASYPTNESLQLNYTVTDNYDNTDTCWFSIDSGANNTISGCINTTFNTAGEGLFTLNLFANDTVDNSDNVSVAFSVDLTDPAASFGPNPEDNSNESSQSVTFGLSCYDNTGVDTVQLWSDWSGTWVMNKTNTSYINDTTWSVQVQGIQDGTWDWAVYCNDTAGRSNWTDSNRTFTVDTIPPVAAITYPANTTYYNVTYFNYTLTETSPDSCWYSINGTSNITMPTCQNATLLSLSEGPNTIEVYANDTSGNKGGDYISFTLDQTCPEYYSLNQNISNSTSYSPSNYVYQFNSTWTDSTVMDTVFIEWEGTNFTASNTTSVYYFDIGSLPAGNYSYKWCGNDTMGNLNCTQTYTYEITKSDVSITNAFSQFPPITYNTAHTPTCHINVSSLTVSVTQHRNSTSYTNDTSYNLPAGDYNYSCIFPGNENYTLSSDEDIFTINRATTRADIIIAPATPTTYGTDITPVCYHNNTDTTPLLFTNNTPITNNTAISLSAGTHNISCNVSQTENFTYSLNYTLHDINRASNDLTMTGTGTQTYPYQSTIDCSSLYSTPNLYRNSTLIPFPPDINIHKAGTYNYSCNISQSDNYTANLTYQDLIIQQNSSNPVSLHLNNSRSNLTITFGQSVNVSGFMLYTASGTPALYMNDSPVSNPYQLALAYGNYVFKVNTTGNENYTSNTTGDTLWLSVNKADTKIDMYHNETLWTFTYTFPVPETVEVNGTINVSSLQGSVECFFNSTSSMNPNATHYTSPSYLNWSCHYPGSQNYTSSSGQQFIDAQDTIDPVVAITHPVNTTYYNVTYFNFTVGEVNPDSCWYSINGTSNITMPTCQNGTLLSLSEGSNTLDVYVNDTSGNLGSGNVSFTLDQTEPQITIVSPGNTTYPTQTVYFNVSLQAGENGSWCGYSLDGTVTVNETMARLSDTYFWEINTTMSDGNHNATFYCNDTVSNLNSSTEYFIVDTDIPVLVITYPANITYYNVTYFNYTITKANDSCWYNLNYAGNITSACGNNTAIPTSEGPNILEAYYNDSLGNIAFDAISFTADWTDPDTTIPSPGDFYETSSNAVSLNCTVTDNNNITNLSLYLNATGQWLANETVPVYSGTYNSTNFTLSISEGTYIWNCISFDSASNFDWGDSNKTFTVDNTPPVVNIVLPASTQASNESISLNYTADATASSCWYNINNGANTSLSGCTNTTFNVPGTGQYTANVYSNDTVGNTGSDSSSFWVGLNTTSVNIITPLNITYTGDVDFNVTLGAGENGSWCGYSLNGAGNVTINKINVTYFSMSNSTIPDGQYVIIVTCNNTFGSINSSIEYFSVDKTVPQITIYQPQNQTLNSDILNVTFSEYVNTTRYQLYYIGINVTFGSGWSAQTTMTGLSDGFNCVIVWANDSYSNHNSTTRCWTRDTTPPNITFVSPTLDNQTTSLNYTYVNLTIDESGQCILEWNGTNETMSNATQSETYFLNKTLLPNGNYTFKSWCNDTLGNMNVSEMRWVNINWTVPPPPDTTPPELTIIAPSNNTLNDDLLNLTFSETVNWSAYELDSSGVNLTIGAVPVYANPTMGFSDGAHRIIVYANDSSGNVNSSSVCWTKDTTAPDIYNVINLSTAIRAFVYWETGEQANATASYSTANSSFNLSATNTTFSSSHNMTLQYLTKNTTYYYNITSCDSVSNCNTTGPYAFRTSLCNASWSCGAWSTCSSSQQSRTCTDSNQCQYPYLTTETQSCDDGGGRSSGSSVYIAPSPVNVTVEVKIVPAVNVSVLVIKHVSEASGNYTESMLVNMSREITPHMNVQRYMYFSGVTTKLRTTLSYTGTKAVKDFIVTEYIPKEFATNASIVVVSAPGGAVTVIEDDPAWMITYPEIMPGDDMHILYEVQGTKSSSVTEDIRTELFAGAYIQEPYNESAPVSCTPSVIICEGGDILQCSSSGNAWTLLETCDRGCSEHTLSCIIETPSEPAIDALTMMFIAILILVIVVTAVAFATRKKSPEKAKPAAKKKETGQKPLLHRPEEISRDIIDGEPDLIISTLEMNKLRDIVKGDMKPKSSAEKKPAEISGIKPLYKPPESTPKAAVVTEESLDDAIRHVRKVDEIGRRNILTVRDVPEESQKIVEEKDAAGVDYHFRGATEIPVYGDESKKKRKKS
ncbi:MAG: hypothetical protein JW789_02600 [Candidatus Aenigmarchaeota archaeon]|nr:hypothetical protein [Candidatus Aenigmarchaeota archaeon]